MTSPFPILNLKGLPRSLEESNFLPLSKVPSWNMRMLIVTHCCIELSCKAYQCSEQLQFDQFWGKLSLHIQNKVYCKMDEQICQRYYKVKLVEKNPYRHREKWFLCEHPWFYVQNLVKMLGIKVLISSNRIEAVW